LIHGHISLKKSQNPHEIGGTLTPPKAFSANFTKSACFTAPGNPPRMKGASFFHKKKMGRHIQKKWGLKMEHSETEKSYVVCW